MFTNPHFAFSAALDGVDIRGAHFVVCLLGSLMALYVMQLWSHGAIVAPGECQVSYYLRRVALWIVSLAMLWSLAYQSTKGWEPWPPDMFVLIGIDLFLASSIIVAVRRNRAFG